MTRISIGICAYNEERNIWKLLRALASKECAPEESEIVVVASGCTDRTAEIVENAQRTDTRIRLIEEKERRGKSAAVNILIRECRGEILVMMGADVIPKKNSIERLLRPFRSKNVGGTTGHPIPVNRPELFMGREVNLIWKIFHEIASYESRKGTFFHLSGELCALRKDALEIIPMKVINDDTYLGWRAKTRGWKIIYVPEAIVFMKAATSLTEFYRQRKRIVQGHLQIQRFGSVHISTLSPFMLPRFLLKCVPMSLGGVLSAALAAVLEIMTHVTARVDLIRGNIPYVWTPVESTKSLGQLSPYSDFQVMPDPR